MKHFKLNKLLRSKAFIFSGLFCASSELQAFNYQQYSRSFSLVFDKIEDARLDESYVQSNSDFLYNFGGSYVDAPLFQKGSQSKALIEYMASVNFGVASYLKPWLMVGANTSYTFFRDNQGINASGFGDVQLLTKLRVMNEGRWALSFIPYVNIPTAGAVYTVKNGPSNLEGKRLNVLSDEGFGYGMKLATEFLTRYVQFALNVGYRFSDKAVVYDNNKVRISDMTHQLLTGFGAYLPLHKSFGLGAEYMRLWSNPIFKSKVNPSEFMLTASAGLSPSVNGFLGFALGNLLARDDGNDYRIVAGLKIAPCVWGDVCKKTLVEKAERVEHVQSAVKEYVESTPPVAIEKQKEDAALFSGEEVIQGVNQDSATLGDSDLMNVPQEPAQASFGAEVTYVVRYPQNIAFISMKDRARLKKVIVKIKADIKNIKAIKIVGHASAEGDSSINKKISYVRAIMVKDELVKLGIPSSMIEMGYFGSDQPSEADLPANRRVELQIVR